MRSWRGTSPPRHPSQPHPVTCEYCWTLQTSAPFQTAASLAETTPPFPPPGRTVRKEFINAKYVDHKYARKTCTSAAAKMIELFEAVQSRDLLALIQVYAEGVELMEPLPEVGPVSARLLLMCKIKLADYSGPRQPLPPNDIFHYLMHY